MVDNAPAVELAVGGERGETVVITGERQLTDRARRRIAFPAERTGGHVADLQFTASDREIALIAFGGVDAFTGSGERFAVVDLAPATQALAVRLDLRIHRPDLLFAGTADEDHRDIAENQPSGSDGRVLGFLKGNERLQESERCAVISVRAHFAGLADDDEGLRRRRQQDLFDRSGVRRDDEGSTGGHAGLAAETLALGEANRGEQWLAGGFLADDHQARLRALGVPDFEARHARLTDRDRSERRDDRFDRALAGGIKGRAIGNVQFLDGPVGEAEEDQTSARVAANRGDAQLAQRGGPLVRLGAIGRALEDDLTIREDDVREVAVFVFTEGDGIRGNRERADRRDLGAGEEREDLEDQEGQHPEDREHHADTAEADEATHPPVSSQGHGTYRKTRLRRRRRSRLYVGSFHRVTVWCLGF